LGEQDREDPAAAADDLLAEMLGGEAVIGSYDVVGGLVGWGAYCLERLPRPRARANLERIVDALLRTAELKDEGITWHTKPEWLSPFQLENAPTGMYNLGLAHGAPGVIALLAAARSAGFADTKVASAVENASRWVLAQELPSNEAARFPSWVVPGTAPKSSRCAWCYGDPGVAVAVLRAARAVGDAGLAAKAVAVAVDAANRPLPTTGVVDAGICHGAAGLAHIYNRMFQASGDDRLREAACSWYERTLDLRRPGSGVAGFGSYKPHPSRSDPWVTDPGLLTGAAGIGLALLAAVSTVEPDWDRALMTAVPVMPA
jgi:lantibiotic modifying enzyme